MLSKVVVLKGGFTGRVIGQFNEDEFLMIYGKGGRTQPFRRGEVIEVKD